MSSRDASSSDRARSFRWEPDDVRWASDESNSALKVADAPSKEDDAERLRQYWAHGEGALKVRWGEPGDFDRCVRHVSKFMDDPQGYCAERHHDALGIWPATHAKEIRGATGGKAAKVKLVKVGPHGYIHGWIYVGPAGSVGETLDHPDHGTGKIIAEDKKSITVEHASGDVKHYAATFAPQKSKFIKTGSLEGKTHIANVKADKSGVVTNNDDGKVIGDVYFKKSDGTWAYVYKDASYGSGGYASKHKAIQGLIAHHNEVADQNPPVKEMTDVTPPKLEPPKPVTAVKPAGAAEAAGEDWKKVPPLSGVGALKLTPNYAQGPGHLDISHAATGIKIGELHDPAASGNFTATHASGEIVGTYPNKIQGMSALVKHHNAKITAANAAALALTPDLPVKTGGTAAPSGGLPDKVDIKDLTIGAIGPKGLTVVHGPTGQELGHVDYYETKLSTGESAPHGQVSALAALQSFTDLYNEKHGAPAPSGPDLPGHVDGAETEWTNVNGFNVKDSDTGKTFAHGAIPTSGGFDVKHADGNDIGHYDDVNDAQLAAVKYHNGKYGHGTDATPTTSASAAITEASVEPYKKIGHLDLSDVTGSAGSTGQTIKTSDGEHVGTINYDTGAAQGYASFTHADGTTHAISAFTSNEAKNVLLTYHNVMYGDKAGAVAEATKPKPWLKAGSALTPKDVVSKLNGDVIHKGTGEKIGTIDKTYGWNAHHEDGTTVSGSTKKAALVNLINHHNVTTGVHDAVQFNQGGPVAQAQKLPSTYNLTFDHATGEITDSNGQKIGDFKYDYATQATMLKDSVTGAAWVHHGAIDYFTKKSFLTAHNDAIDRAAGVAPKTSSLPAAVHSLPVPGSSSSGGPQLVVSTKTHLTSPLSSPEKAAIKKYTGSWYARINPILASQKLLGDQVPTDASAAAAHSGLNKSELAQDMTLHRGIHDAVGMLGSVGSAIGKVQIQHSFMSTSTKQSTASAFGYGGLLLTVKAPKGAKGMDVKSFSHYGGEAEILFQHGTMYHVDSDEVGSDGVRRATITLVGLSSSTGNHETYAKFGGGSG